jgi:transposase-like protein
MPARRQFSNEYKVKILQEADQCTRPGEVKALLEREGLYSSYLTAWRRQRDEGALSPSKHNGNKNRKPNAAHDLLLEENRRLQQVNEDLRSRLRQAEVVIEVQKKVAAMVGALLKTIDSQDVQA